MSAVREQIKFIQEDPSPLNAFLKGFQRITLLMDTNTLEYCYPKIKDSLPDHETILIEPGEIHKNIQTLQLIWSRLTSLQMDRKSLLLNLGGGVICDMGGFAAATFKRGMAFAHIPTTLLSMTDGSVGGKLGIDYEGYKNHIGLFQDPSCIFINPTFLKSLPREQVLSGYAEVVKHSLLSDQKDWQQLTKEGFPMAQPGRWIEHSIDFKAGIVEQDPKETQGLRKQLNLGHTIGHALESWYLNELKQPQLHGLCVAVGLIAEVYLSNQKTGLSASERQAIENYIQRVFPSLSFDKEAIPAIAQNALQDKKNENGLIKCTLLKAIGQPLTDKELSIEEVEDALRYYHETHTA